MSRSKRGARALVAGAWLCGAWLGGCGSSEPASTTAGDPVAERPGEPSVSAPAPEASAGVPAPESPAAPAVAEQLPRDVAIVGEAGAESGAGSRVPDAGGGGATGDTPAELQPLTVWLAGDSTVANGQTPCPRGWGRSFAPLFDERVTVNNAAAGGRSVHTWLYEVLGSMDESGECELARDASGAPALQPRWQAMLDGMREGDYLFIQFGINDGDRSCDRHVGIEAFKAAYAMMAGAARERGATPIFITPVSMVRCSGSTATGSRGEFVPATLDVGAELGVPVIDLHALSVALFQELGFCPIPGGDVSAQTTGPVGDFFCDDHTHFSELGAPVIAGVVARALSDQGIPLAAYLR